MANNINKNRLLILSIVIMSAFAITAVAIHKNNNGINKIGIVESSNKSIFTNSEMRTDTEPLQKRFQWLTIIECEWKTAFFDNSNEFPPGNSDLVVCGYIMVDSIYLNDIKTKYNWYENNNVEVGFLPTEYTRSDLNFLSSKEYKDYYLTLLGNGSVEFYIDFEHNVLYFAGVLRAVSTQ